MKTFLKGVAAAAIGGATSTLFDPESLVKDPKHSARMAAAGAIIAVLGYLAKSPIADNNGEKK